MKSSSNFDLRAIDFLNNFDTETRSHIIDFGKRISSDELVSDVYLIMARKAICFVDYLVEVGLASLNGIIVSDRVLDMDLDWIKGKSVTIIDDALISGTTIYKAIAKLKDAGVLESNIKVFVLSVNTKWYNDSMLTNSKNVSYLQKPIFYQSDEKCVQTCYDIVQALSTIPRPYDIDFPLFTDMLFSEQELQRLLNNSWIAADVTSSFRKSCKYRQNASSVTTKTESITLFPPANSVEKLFSSLHIENILERCTLKMRTYIRKRKKDKEEIHISFLPFTIIDNLSFNEIDAVIEKLYPDSESLNIISNSCISYSSKFRIIQYSISIIFAKLFFEEMSIQKNGNYNGLPDFEQRRLQYIFPTTSNIPLLLNSFYKNFSIENTKSIDINYTISTQLCSQKMVELSPQQNPLKYHVILSNMFLDLYSNKEKDARKLAKEKGKEVFNDIDNEKSINRLNEGYTFKNIVDKISDAPCAKLISSIFLDYAIDAGVAVPITKLNETCISRAYRHGEDVIFSNEEAKLLAYMLLVFMTNTNKEFLSATLIEKLLTSFIRLGIDDIFEKYDFKKIHSQVCDYIKIVYNLHGSTVLKFKHNANDDYSKVKPYSTSEVASSWLRVILEKDYHFLYTTTDNTKRQDFSSESGNYYFSNESKKCLNDEFEVAFIGKKAKSARKIAKTLAYFYNKQLISLDDLILMNATTNCSQIFPALLAEIEIVKSAYKNNNYEYLIKKAFNDRFTFNWLRSLKTHKIYIAMNSGKWKYVHYLNDFTTKKIKQIYDERNNDIEHSEIYDNWDDLWTDRLSIQKEILDENVLELLSQSSSYIIQYGLIFRVFDYLAFISSIGSECVKKYFLALNESLKTNCTRTDKLKAIKTFNEQPEFSPLINYFKVCDIEINSKTYNDQNLIIGAQNATVITNDINEYITLLENICRESGKNYLLSNEILTIVKEIINKTSYDPKDLISLLNHLSYLNMNIQTIQDRACMFLNNQGEIEEPTKYNNVLIVKFSDNASDYLKIKVENLIKNKQKKISNETYLLYQNLTNDKCDFIIFSAGNDSERTLQALAYEINNKLNHQNEINLVLMIKINNSLSPYNHRSCSSSASLENFRPFYSNFSKSIEHIDNAFLILGDISPINANDPIHNMKDAEIKVEIKNKERNTKIKYMDKKTNKFFTMPKGFTIAIMCAKNTEINGVKDALESKFNFKLNPSIDKKMNFSNILSGDFSYNGFKHKIILKYCEQGNTNSAIAYASLSHFKPDYIFFCGIAGTINKEINIGDVFIPFEIFDITLKKETTEKFQLRSNSYKIRSNHKGLLEQFIAKSIYSFKLSSDSGLSDNSVYANEYSQILRDVKTMNDQIKFIEMESAGLFGSDYTRDETQYGVYTVRGISDKADTAKNDQFHELAISNASQVLADLLAFLFNNQDTIKQMK